MAIPISKEKEQAEPCTAKWEEIDAAGTLVETFGGGTYRMKVPGGWLILFREPAAGAALEFLSDLRHTWKLESTYQATAEDIPF